MTSADARLTKISNTQSKTATGRARAAPQIRACLEYAASRAETQSQMRAWRQRCGDRRDRSALPTYSMALKRSRDAPSPPPNVPGAPTTPSRPYVAKHAAVEIAIRVDRETATSWPVFASEQRDGLPAVEEVAMEVGDGQTIEIGRAVARDAGDGSKVRLFSGIASGRHCSLVGRAGRMFVRDDHSSNGTVVNGVERGPRWRGRADRPVVRRYARAGRAPHPAAPRDRVRAAARAAHVPRRRGRLAVRQSSAPGDGRDGARRVVPGHVGLAAPPWLLAGPTVARGQGQGSLPLAQPVVGRVGRTIGCRCVRSVARRPLTEQIRARTTA